MLVYLLYLFMGLNPHFNLECIPVRPPHTLSSGAPVKARVENLPDMNAKCYRILLTSHLSQNAPIHITPLF